MSDTPRTDFECANQTQRWYPHTVVKTEFACQLERENTKMRDGLQRITKIPNRMYGGDWDEIEEARMIAKDALLSDINIENNHDIQER